MKSSKGLRILLGCPVPVETVSGPATVARELISAWSSEGDRVQVMTFSSFEKSLPPGLRQAVLFLRALPACLSVDAVFLLDPASVGPGLALAASITGRRSVLRVGGDFLWETYVERTQEPLRLSDFYTTDRAFSFREKNIRSATNFTLHLVSSVAFTTNWQKELWKKSYALEDAKCVVVSPALPPREEAQANGKVFLSAGRGMRIKNGVIMKRVWELVAAKHPEAVLDDTPRPPKEYREALKHCYAVIVPSLSEVSPNAALEALRYGKPFIATKDTGIYEELKDAGIFVDTRTPEAIADAVVALLAPGAYEKAQERLRLFTSVRSWEEVAMAYRSLMTTPT